MRFFPKTKPKHRKKTKTLKELLSDSLTSAVKKDPDLMRELAFKEGGYSDLLHRDNVVEDQKRQIKSYITSQALEKIKSDPELSERFIEDQVENILYDGKPKRSRRELDYDDGYGVGSSISQALEEVESLSELKDKLETLGMGGKDGQGFLSGLKLKDILEAIPHLSSVMGSRPAETISQRIYLVKVNGSNTEVNENEYRTLLQQGRLKPLAELEPPEPQPKLEVSRHVDTSPETETRVEEPEEPISELESKEQEYLEIPVVLRDIDFSMIGLWLEQEPEDFVAQLKDNVSAEDEESKFIWGILTSVPYEDMIDKISPYSTNPEVGSLVKKVMSIEGKIWMEKVIELVKEE